jgi:hypothetical protein
MSSNSLATQSLRPQMGQAESLVPRLGNLNNFLLAYHRLIL